MKPIGITLNGQDETTLAANVAELLRERGAPEKGVAVAVNGSVVRRADHAQTPVREGDKIEVIRAVQGG
jgi:sulfur carrier protein